MVSRTVLRARADRPADTAPAPLELIDTAPIDKPAYDVLVLVQTDDGSEEQADDYQALFRILLEKIRCTPHGKITLHIQHGVTGRITCEESIVIK